jgi:hypothetical protein
MSIDPIAAYIIQAAKARGIDPDVALTVAGGEGGTNNPFRHGEGPAPRTQDPKFGRLENSFGPFQLYISGTGAGLGDRAVAAGIDPRTNWQGGIDFALDEAKRAGWGQWYGAKAKGITGRMGIGGAPGPGPVTASAPSPTPQQPTALGDLVAPAPVAPASAPPGIADAIATFMQSRKDREEAAAAEQARRQALFGGGLGGLYG